MTQKPKMPIAAQIIPTFYTASLWAYPVAPDGLGNLAAFAAWGFASLSLLILLLAMFMPKGEDKYQGNSAPVKWAIRVGVWGGAAWLAYHGAFALAGLVVVTILLALVHGVAQKQAKA